MPRRLESATLEGVVAQTNATGLQVNGAWYNFSQYGEDLRALAPRRGQRVRLTYETARNGRRYLRDLACLDAGPASGPPRTDTPPLSVPPQDPTRAQRATRLACLEAAARFAAPRERYKGAAEVVAIAEVWHRWALGELEPRQVPEALFAFVRLRGAEAAPPAATAAGGAR